MTWQIAVENVAGLRSGRATIEPGLNVVRGSNWTGKSSFIAALETALGTATPLTEGQDHGEVTLETTDRRVQLELTRDGDGIVRRGVPLLSDDYDVVRADLYACLDDDNPLRQAVRRGENLEQFLTEPLDLENVDERIADLKAERRRVTSERDGAEEAARRLPTVEERIGTLEDDVEGLRERLESIDGPDSETGGEREALSEARAELDRVAARVERLESSVERTEETTEEKRAALDDLEPPPADDVDAELAEAREELASLQADAEVLQTLHSANRLVLDEDRLELIADVEHDLAGKSVTCWVCGDDAHRETIADRVEALGDELSEVRAAAERARDRVEELEARREKRAQAERRRATLQEDLAELESTLDERRGRLADARTRRQELAERVESLSAAVEESVEAVTDVESEIKYREAELEEARDERATLESRAEQLERLQDRETELTEGIEALRNRKDELRRRAREAFDDAMGDLLDRFDTGFETARLTPSFDLVVARDGREASLDALSEGELELLGFVAALAGYESFEVADTVPVLLVDGVGSLATANLATLVAYLEDRTEYLVVTAHPEDSPVEGTVIDPAEWTVVSDEVESRSS
jgi:chromosome segregation ATPase